MSRVRPLWARLPIADPCAPTRAVSQARPAFPGPGDSLRTAAQMPAPFREHSPLSLGSATHCRVLRACQRRFVGGVGQICHCPAMGNPSILRDGICQYPAMGSLPTPSDRRFGSTQLGEIYQWPSREDSPIQRSGRPASTPHYEAGQSTAMWGLPILCGERDACTLQRKTGESSPMGDPRVLCRERPANTPLREKCEYPAI